MSRSRISDPNSSAQLTVKIAGLHARGATGQILTAGAINAINSFDKPDTVMPRSFHGASVTADELRVDLPSKSLVVLELR